MATRAAGSGRHPRDSPAINHWGKGSVAATRFSRSGIDLALDDGGAVEAKLLAIDQRPVLR